MAIVDTPSRDWDGPGKTVWTQRIPQPALWLTADATVAMLLPPRSQYVNAHSTTFHLWEIAGEEMPGVDA